MSGRVSVDLDLHQREIRIEVTCQWWRGDAETFRRIVPHDDGPAILSAIREALSGRVLGDKWERVDATE